ncbi:MAG: hypothetical protein K2H98_03235 [Duncaniella sp.]|nr:hypothetical protein [Duncaniella sp.]
MSSSTIGERRGLIILLALILITALVSAIISSVSPQAEPQLQADSIIVTPAPVTDSAVQAQPVKRRQRKAPKPKTKKAPRYRSPLDEPV